MAPVEYKICQLYAEKSTNLLMLKKCASYFRRINQSFSNCSVCKSFAGLHNIFIFFIFIGHRYWDSPEFLAMDMYQISRKLCC